VSNQFWIIYSKTGESYKIISLFILIIISVFTFNSKTVIANIRQHAFNALSVYFYNYATTNNGNDMEEMGLIVK